MILSPSIMCADLGNLCAEVEALDRAGADVFHLDIMDGVFAPNFALSWGDVAAVRQATAKEIDVHLMVREPAVHLPYAFKNKVDIIYVHFETAGTEDLLRTIRDNGAQAGLAINPESEISGFRKLLRFVDRLLVMRVRPGFAGQSPIDGIDTKLAELTQLRDGFTIALDGAVSPDVIEQWKAHGVDEFILGTSSLFNKGRAYQEILVGLRGRMA